MSFIKGFWLLLGVLLFSSTSWGFPRKVIYSETVQYFYGPIKYYSPDGKTLYSEGTSLVKRTVSPSENRITETFSRAPRTHGEKPMEFTAIMARKGGTAIFDLTDTERSFVGTITYKGSEWHWVDWEYAVNLTGGGKIVGHGNLTKRGLQTSKLYTDGLGVPSVRVTEDMPLISAKEYQELHRQFESKPEI